MKAEADTKAALIGSKAVIALFGLLFGLTALLAILSLPLGVYAVLFTTITPGLGANSLTSIFVWVGPVPLELPFAVPIGLLFVLLVSVYAALFALAAFRNRNLSAAFSAGFREGFSVLLSNDLVVAIISIGFLTFTALVIDTLVTANGVPIGELTGNDLSIFVSATTAPLVEETGFRVCIVGVVAALLSLEKPPKALLKALWRPATVYENEEIRAGKIFVLLIVLAASSILFGLLHVTSGSGWDIGKLPEAAYGGLVLGYLYIKYGFHVAVLTHWGIDYFGTAFSFFGQGVYGIPWGSVPGYILQQVVSVDLTAGIGLVSFLLVAYLGVTRLVQSRAASSRSTVGSP